MSTNPFDNDFHQTTAGSSSNNPFADNFNPKSMSMNTSRNSPPRNNHPINKQSAAVPPSANVNVNMNSSKPPLQPSNNESLYRSNNANNNSNNNNNNPERDPIWEARGIEWPLMKSSHHLKSSTFNRLYKKSKLAGTSIGISITYNNNNNSAGTTHSASEKIDGSGGNNNKGDKSGGSGSSISVSGGSGGGLTKQNLENLNKSGGSGAGGDSTSKSIAEGGAAASTTTGYYSALGGFMGKLIGGQNQNITDELLDDNTTRTLRPPRQNCIAAANGWIMAAIESTPVTIRSSSTTTTFNKTNASSNSSTSTNNTNRNHNNNDTNNSGGGTYQLPPLRLISRWNVRRGSSDSSTKDGSGGLIPLPPPVIPSQTTPHGRKTTSSSSNRSSSSKPTNIMNIEACQNPLVAGRIMHIFVDPTGCHTIISALNGEAYYIHSLSNNQTVRKLKGFGPNTDGKSSSLHGIAMNELPTVGGSSDSSSIYQQKRGNVQMGLTDGSYVTSVGWDRFRGTEGSTKKILIGTSIGEIYEYSLSASLSSGDGGSGKNTGGGSSGGSVNDDGSSSGKEAALAVVLDDELPLLLVRLNSREKSYGRIHQNENSIVDGGAVSGLHFERLGGGSSSTSMNQENDLIVLAVTSGVNKQTRLHTYLSIPSDNNNSLSEESKSGQGDQFHGIFSSNESSSRRSFVELPGSINYADLKICGEGFAMRTETGIYYGTIDKSNSMTVPFNKASSGIVDAGILPYDSTNCIPVSLAITPHHFITLSDTNEVKFINRIAKKVIQKEKVDWVSLGQGIGAVDDGLYSNNNGELIMDVRRPHQVWLWKSRSLVHISSTREDRDVWKFSLESCLSRKGPTSMRNRSLHAGDDDKFIDAEFDKAKHLCTNNVQKAVVTAARAKYHLSQNRIELAAKYMAQCPPELMPFAETSIQLALPTFGIGITSSEIKDASRGGNAGLISYLLHKMQYYKARNDNVACTMIGAWLVELYLHERERNVSDDSSTSGMSSPKSPSAKNMILQQFLSSNAYNMDAHTILRILCSHDATANECAMYAASSGDIGTAVNAALCMADAKTGALDALRVLSDSPIEQAEPFYYKFAFTLLCRAPQASSKSFLARFSHGLDATKLLPAFMRYEKRRGEEKEKKKSGEMVSDIEEDSFVDDASASVSYFEGAITLGCRSTAVFNYLVSLYVKMDNEVPLYGFVSKHVSSSSTVPGIQPKQSSPLDMNYALSTILQSGRHFRSAIKLYMGFGMRFRAVELAIKVQPEMAKELASESVEREEKKRLWLMIARNAAMEGESLGGKEVVSKVLSVLSECGPGILSIEDVLPFLPDIAQIDQFKDEICDALTSYSSKIEEYMKEMSDCDQTCNSLREEIRRLGDFSISMCSEARCAFTGKVVAEGDEPFYVFPSGYVAFEDALKKEVMPYLNDIQQSKVRSIEEQITDLRSKVNSANTTNIYWEKSDEEYRLDALQAELDGLIAAECPLTGSVMVESIDRCFDDTKEDELYIASEDVVMGA